VHCERGIIENFEEMSATQNINGTRRSRVKLYNTSGLAEVIEVGRTTISAMKRLGFKFLYGRRTTVRSALDWMAAHPEFRQRQAYPSKARNGSPRNSKRAGKCDEQLSRKNQND
jgi:hypothetical protein